MGMSSQTASSTAVLRVRGLCFGFDGNRLFDDWSADFLPGLSLVLGGDGAGKTSLLRLLAADAAPQAGQLVLRGTDVGQQGHGYRAQVFWRDPRAPWPDTLTPQAWADAIAPEYANWSGERWRAHVAGFGLEPHLHKAMHQLSTGSQRKVLLAAALASGAALTLIDEPVAALDKASIAYLLQALDGEVRLPGAEGRAIIVAHYEAPGELPWRQIVTL